MGTNLLSEVTQIKSILPLIAVLLNCTTIFAQSPQLDIYFIQFESSNKGPQDKYYANSDAIAKMYSRYNAVRLPVRISDKGKIEVIVSCDDILNVGMCIPLSKFDTLTISSDLRVFGTADGKSLTKVIKELIPEASDKETGLVFIRLDSILKEAYHQENYQVADDECCSEEEKIIWQDQLKLKLCSILRTKNALKVSVSGSGSKLINDVHLRSFGLSSGDLSNGGKVSKIEPRQYVTIYEKENGKVDPIWWLLKKPDDLIKVKYPEYGYIDPSLFEKFYPVQKFQVIDKDAILEIRFDQEMLAKNIDFYGNISLAATIGNRPIEVSPYSMIGKAQKAYGVNNRPIKEIASHFLYLFIEADKAIKSYECAGGDGALSEEAYRNIANTLINNVNDIKRYLLEIQSKYLNENSFFPINNELFDKSQFPSLEKVAEKLNAVDAISILNKELRDLKNESIQFDDHYTTKSLKNIKDNVNNLNEEEKELGTQLIQEINYSIQNFNNKLLRPTEDLLLHVSELTNILESGDLKSILEEISDKSQFDIELIKDIIKRLDALDTSTLKQQIKPSNDQYVIYLPELRYSEKDPTVCYKQFLFNVDLCLQYMDYFKESGLESMNAFLSLSELTNIRFEASYTIIQNNYQKLVKSLGLRELQRHDEHFQYFSYIQSIVGELEYLRERLQILVDMDAKESSFLTYAPAYVLQNNYKQYQREIAQRAGYELFNRMLYATIDLEESGAKEGEYLEIKVMWYNIDPNTPNAEEGIELSTAKFYLKQIGWNLSVTESAFLVKRIDEDLVTSNVSPSDFKPTAGASLLWGYSNSFRGKYKFLRWLEPSFGINVSYADFTTTKDFEVTLGPVIGFWRNKIFFTGGYNFNVDGQSPFYIGIGFSFSNIFATIESKITNKP